LKPQSGSLGTVALAAVASLAIGCTHEAGELPENVGEVDQEIINGTPVAAGTDFWGTPWYGCSATLIRYQWALTAKHCATPASVVFNTGGPAVNVTKAIAHPTLDVKLLRLAEGRFPSPHQGPFPLFRSPATWLGGKTLYCQGWGANAADCGLLSNGNWNSTCTGGGVLRSANVFVDASPSPDPLTFRMIRTGGKIQGPADSGSSCLTIESDFQRRKMTGVTSYSHTYDETHIWDMHLVLPQLFRDWANGITGGAPTLGAQAGYERADSTDAVVYRSGSGMKELWKPVASPWVLNTLPSTGVASNPATFVYPDGWSSIIYRDSANKIRETYRFPGAASWTQAILSNALEGEPSAAGDPAAYVRSDGWSTVVYRSTGNQIVELGVPIGGSSWSWQNLTTSVGAPLAASDPIGFVRHDAVNSIVYRDVNGAVMQLARSVTNPNWSYISLNGNVANGAAAPPAVGKPFGFSTADDTSGVVYKDASSQIWLLMIPASGGYPTKHLVSGTMLAIGDPIGYVRSDGVTQIVFQVSGGHIMAVDWSPGRYGIVSDLTQLSGAPNAAIFAGSMVTAYVRSDRTNAVLFKSTAGQIWEMSSAWWSHNHWYAKNMSQEAGGI
jgi:hypothetical protein